MEWNRREFKAFKARVIIEALKERNTLDELAMQFNLHPILISAWKQEFFEKPEIFETVLSEVKSEEEIKLLYSQVS